MLNYIVTHWRGQQSLAHSILVNLVVSGYLVTMPLTLLSLGSKTPKSLEFISLGVAAIWLVWIITGLTRCALRYAKDRTKAVVLRVAGGLTFFVLWSAIFSNLGEMLRLMHIVKPLRF